MKYDSFQYANEGLGGLLGPPDQAHSSVDPMDLDVDLDFEGLSWAHELNHSLSHVSSELDMGFDGSHGSHQQPNLQFSAGYPLDLLFFEDEGTLPLFFDTGSQQGVSHLLMGRSDGATPLCAGQVQSGIAALGMSDTGLQQLRHQLALLAGGSCGDELVFKDCESSKAIALHNLAIEFGLNYTHDAGSCAVSISRNDAVSAPPSRLAQSNIPSITGSWGIDAQMPTVEASFSGDISKMDNLDSLFEKFIQEPPSTNAEGLPPVPRYELTESYLPSYSISEMPAREKATNQGLDNEHETRLIDHASDKQPLDRQPSRSERIGRSISKHVSGWKSTIAKGGRRGPLTHDGRRDMKALEGAGGACWRCKVLRRKCNPGSTCRCCLQSVATPSVGEDAPLWPNIGCRRGKLRDAMVEQVLCPKARGPRQSHESGRCGSFRSRRSVEGISDRCLLAAESQRLADMKAVLEGASYKISIAHGDMRGDFVSFVEAGRYRNQECLYRTFPFQDSSVTYSELIATIAWELAENKSVLPLLEIKSWKALMSMLETACIYEAEVGQTSLVIISMICLRQCLQALRLSSADLLSAKAHDDCTSGHCQVHYIRELLLGVRMYIDELSTVIFNKDNMRDRRWWLSTFYSLYIQSCVRHAIIAIEKQLCFPDLGDVPAEDLASTQYLHLAGVLFTAASAKYDPLLGGQYQYALTDNSVIPETSIPELHHSSVRTACEVDTWGEAGIKSSYQFLRQLLQIGSLDFDELGQKDFHMHEVEGSDFMEEPGVNADHNPPPSLWKTTSSSIYGLESPRDSISFHQAPSFRSHRASIDSRYSIPSFTSMSNPSEESVAKTFATDMTSIYEVPIEDIISKPTATSSNMETAPNTEANSNLTSFWGHGITKVTPGPVPNSSVSVSCGCCPKSPRSFSTIGELSLHESEKPHACSQPGCKMRFKSPKEAERHINAIHLKSDYWSCEALNSPLLAFHCETFSGSTYDVCGFCGGGFERKQQMTGLDKVDEDGVNELELVSHLDSVHKRGECNRERKFYRVDNFRQHLKTAHVAKPGKWLKILEKNCKAGDRP